ncbi:hypothetical protein [Legionella sp. km772]|uniref:hypothetical protein n=1 Tax=Legionella sp. km772 TaxID=2498111 RepID=UPI000F8C4A67|nr:hypothetical protein [Legionella sp. km772]RUR05283.1 hypothetical protein ELY15_14520 [Legionella sp. km772]
MAKHDPKKHSDSSSIRREPPQQESSLAADKQTDLIQAHKEELRKTLATHKKAPEFEPPKQELRKADPKPAELMTPELFKPLEKWAEDFFNTPEQGIVQPGSEESPATYLSQHGLKTPKAVATFLLTPAGRTVTEEIAERQAIDQERRNEQLREQREHELLMQRIKIALLLWYLGRKAHASKKVNELILDQIEKAEKRLHKAAEQLKSPEESKYTAALEEVIQDYEKAIKAAQEEAHALDEKGTLLKQDHAFLMGLGLKLDQKYATYDTSLNEMSALQLHDEHGNLDEVAFNDAQAKFTEEMHILQKEIDSLIENDQDPGEALQKLNALNLKFASMHDMKAISEGRKYALETTVDGEEAHFVINKGDQLMTLNDDDELVAVDPNDESVKALDSSKLFFQKSGNQLVKDSDGKMYLLRPGQDLETVKQNPQMSENAQQAAKESFERVKQEVMTVKHVIGLHKGMEKGAHDKRVQATEELISANKAEKDLVDNQVRLLQAVQADARNALRQAPTLSPKPGVGSQITMTPPPPTPRPTVTSSQHSLSSSQVPSVKFTQLLKELQLEGQKNQLSMKYGNNPQSRQLIDKEFNDRLKNGARPLAPNELMQLERRMHAFGKENPIAAQRREQLGQSGPYAALRQDDGPSPTAPRPDPFKTSPY